MTENITAYIFKTLGLKVMLEAYDKTASLPNFLPSNYSFLVATIGEQKFLLMCDQQKMPLTPLAIRKHCNLVHAHWHGPVVFVAETMASYNRARLIQQQIPFIIPDRQLYLPFLGMVFSETDKKSNKEFSGLGLLAQLLILGILNKRLSEPLTIESASVYFDYSRMSVSRAFDELEYFTLAKREVRCGGKEKYLTFTATGQRLWEQALPLLKTPLRHVIGVETLPPDFPACLAGINALAQKTMLSEQSQFEYAVTPKSFSTLKNIEKIPKASAPVLLQIWAYPPELFGDNMVDPLSLYLTLKNDPNERVQIALDELLEGISW
ncbi:MAG: hypothetical protein EOM73_14175 [Bacteroidia bacterium]|nr:hypothetical protein [Bacteroidia bacterium]